MPGPETEDWPDGLRFDLYLRPDTDLTGPLQQAISDGLINPRFIP